MAHDPCWLLDHRQVIILIKNSQGDCFRTGEFFSSCRKLEGNLVTGAEHPSGLGPGAIDLHLTAADPDLNLGSAFIGELGREKLIQANACLAWPDGPAAFT